MFKRKPKWMPGFVASLIIFICLTLPTSCKAGDLWADFMATSYHSNHNANYNQQNPGIGVEYTPSGSDLSYAGMVYENSYKKTAVLLAASYTPLHAFGLKAGAVVGLVSGYPEYNGRFGPVATGLIKYEGEKYGANLIVLPPSPLKNSPGSTWMYAVQFKVKF